MRALLSSVFMISALTGALGKPSCTKRIKLVDIEDSAPSVAPTAVASATLDASASQTTEVALADAGLPDTGSLNLGSLLGPQDAGAAVTPSASAQKKLATPTAAKPAAPGGGGPCLTFCTKYFQCKGLRDGTAINACAQSCNAKKPDPAGMSKLASLDCATLTSLIDRQMRKDGNEPPASAQPKAQARMQCDGCRWDGSKCGYFMPGSSSSISDCNAACCNH